MQTNYIIVYTYNLLPPKPAMAANADASSSTFCFCPFVLTLPFLVRLSQATTPPVSEVLQATHHGVLSWKSKNIPEACLRRQPPNSSYHSIQPCLACWPWHEYQQHLWPTSCMHRTATVLPTSVPSIYRHGIDSLVSVRLGPDNQRR